MRQISRPIDGTGTDHNPMANSILLGGKGIHGNWVVGATDRQSADETISQAHANMDPLSVKSMGRPFDFEEFVPVRDLPTEFKADDYISIESVVNSVYTVFGVDRSRHWSVGRNGRIAKTPHSLLR